MLPFYFACQQPSIDFCFPSNLYPFHYSSLPSLDFFPHFNATQNPNNPKTEEINSALPNDKSSQLAISNFKEANSQLSRKREKTQQDRQSLELFEDQEDDCVYYFKQKYGRNINSSIFLLLMKKISSDKYFLNLAETIISQRHLQIQVQQFVNLMKEKVKRSQSYVSLKKIKSFWRVRQSSNGEQRTLKKSEEFGVMFRILSKLYLKFHHISYVFHSEKMQKESKKIHMKCVRKLLTLFA